MIKNLNNEQNRKGFNNARRWAFWIMQGLIVICTVIITLSLSKQKKVSGGNCDEIIEQINRTVVTINNYNRNERNSETDFLQANADLETMLKEDNYEQDLINTFKLMFCMIKKREVLLHQDTLQNKTLRQFNSRYGREKMMKDCKNKQD